MTNTACKPGFKSEHSQQQRPHMRNNFRHFANAMTAHHPAANIQDNDAQVILEMSVPGFEKSEIKIQIDGSLMKISGQKAPVENQNYKVKEFNLNSFSRSFEVSDKLNTNSIVASMNTGILHITIDKNPEAKPLEIEVK